MHALLLLTALVAETFVLVNAGTLNFVQSSDSELPNLLQSLQQHNTPASETGRSDDDVTDNDKREDDASFSTPCCLPYVWQSKLIIWDGVQSSVIYAFYDYPGRRMATYTLSPEYGYISKQTDDGRYVDMYAFNKTNCVHNRVNGTMTPVCLPKTFKSIGPFQLGPSVNGRHGLTTRVWSLPPGLQFLTLRSSDCAPVDVSVNVGGGRGLVAEYFTDVKTHIEYPSVFDLPPVCCRPMTAKFGVNELEKMNLVGRSILSRFGLDQ